MIFVLIFTCCSNNAGFNDTGDNTLKQGSLKNTGETTTTAKKEIVYNIEKVTAPILPYAIIFGFSDGMARYEVHGPKYPTTLDIAYGFINSKGEEVTPPIFSYAGDFSEGFAVVKYLETGNTTFIDTNGNKLIEPFYGGAYAFSDGLALIVDVDAGFVGYIDKTGKRVLELKVSMRNAWSDGYINGWNVSSFSEGLARVWDGNTSKYGYIDKTGKVVVRCEYDDAVSFKEGLACVRQGGKYGFIDKDGKLIIDFMFNERAYFSEGLAHVYLDNKCVYIDKEGKTKIESNMAGSMFIEGLAVNGKSMGGLNVVYGFIDKTGNQIIDLKYINVGTFKNGLAYVVYEDGTHAYIDKSGKEVVSGYLFGGSPFTENLLIYKETKEGPWGIMKVTTN